MIGSGVCRAGEGVAVLALATLHMLFSDSLPSEGLSSFHYVDTKALFIPFLFYFVLSYNCAK